MYVFCVKQKTAYEMRISDWSSDVCSSDLPVDSRRRAAMRRRAELERIDHAGEIGVHILAAVSGDPERLVHNLRLVVPDRARRQPHAIADDVVLVRQDIERVLGFQRLQLTLRHREMTLAQICFFLFRFIYIHSNIDDQDKADTVIYLLLQTN